MIFLRKKSFVFLFLIIIFLICLFSPGAKGAVKIFFMQLFKAPLKTANAVPKLPSKLPKGKTARENYMLKEKVAELEARIADLNEVEKENQRLRELLDFKKRKGLSTISAQVIGRDSSIWSDTAIIDKGSKNGIFINMAVITNEGLVGRVVEVGPTLSRVMLITDPDSKVGGVLSQSRDLGIIEGTIRNLLRMRYLNIDAQVAEGDTVVTSGLGKIFPKGVLIGQVVKIEMDKTRLYKYAYIKPAVNLGRIEEVLCVK